MEKATKWGMAAPLAVPGTGHNRGAFRGMRRPRCIGIRRGFLASSGTLRGEKLPPTSWDDIWRSTFRDRSWKRHRRTRWHRIAAA